MNYKTDDGWFYAANMSDPNEVQAIRTVFTTVQAEAQAAARVPHPIGMWPAAESRGYKRGFLAWELFSMTYLDELAQIRGLARIKGVSMPKPSQDAFQSWVDQVHERNT